MQAVSKRQQRKKAETRFDRFLQTAPMVSAVLVTLFGVLPLVIVVLIGIIQGTLPQDGWMGEGAGYPIWQPPFWLMWIPGVIVFIWSIVSISQSGKFPSSFWGARLNMATVAVYGFIITFVASIAFGGPQFAALMWLIVLWAVALALIILRSILGGIGLMPKAWR